MGVCFPAIGVLEFRVLGTNFRDYAIVFTQLEFGDEPFNTVQLYSRTETASQEAMGLFTKWSRGLGFPSQQQAQLQKDREFTRAATGEARGKIWCPRGMLGWHKPWGSAQLSCSQEVRQAEGSSTAPAQSQARGPVPRAAESCGPRGAAGLSLSHRQPCLPF
nr:epididymal-specific lipocalin-6 isoform X4 [Saimiri boliviensis boliviensis]